MTTRSRALLIGAALLGPLAVFPAVAVDPMIGIVGCIFLVAFLVALRSPAYPVALWGLPGVVIAVLGSNPFPDKFVALFLTVWAALGVLAVVLRDTRALPMSILVTPPVALSLVLVVLMVIRLTSSPAPEYGSFKLQLFLAQNLTLLVAGILIARRRTDFDLFAGLLLLATTAAGFVVARGLLLGDSQFESFGGRFSIFQGETPITLGRATAQGMLVGAYLLLAAGAFWRKAFALAALPVLGVAFVASGSRGPVVGLVFGLVALIAFTLRDPRARRRIVLLLVAAVIAVAVVPQIVPGHAVGRAFGVLVGDAGDDADLANGRYELWGHAWGNFVAHPIGGLGTGGYAADHPSILYPHNLFLEAAAELGIAGLLCVLGLVAFTAVTLLRLWRGAPVDDRLQVAFVAAAFGAAVVNASFSGDVTFNSAVWLTAGLTLGLARRILPESVLDPIRWTRAWSESAEPLLRPPAGQEDVPAAATQPLPSGQGKGSGVITSPVPESLLRGEVRVDAVPAQTGWSIASLSLEVSPDGREWHELPPASGDDSYDVYLVSRGAAVRRRHVAVVRSRERAEQLVEVLQAEHEGGPETVELEPSRRRPWTTGETHAALWDTSEWDDGSYRLRAVTTDVASHRVRSPEVQVVVDNVAPSVSLDSPASGAALTGLVGLAASARDHVSGVAVVRFELEGASGWVEIATATAEPYESVWDCGSVSHGDHRLRAVAVDRAENEAATDPVPVRIERLTSAVQSVELEPPAEPLAGTVELHARAVDEPTVLWVAFQVSEADEFAWQTVGRVERPPYAVALDTTRLPDGFYDLRAIVGRASGPSDCSRLRRSLRLDNSAVPEPDVSGDSPQTWPDEPTSTPLSPANATPGDSHGDSHRVVPAPPQAWLLEPRPGAVLAGPLWLTAEATATRVRFEGSLDGQLWWELGRADAEPFAAVWDTRTVPDGTYWVRPVAGDAYGRSSPGGAVQVSVANAPAPLPPPLEAEPVYAAVPDQPPAMPMTIWELERLLASPDGDETRRARQRALLSSLRGCALPDGTIPPKYSPFVQAEFGDLLG